MKICSKDGCDAAAIKRGMCENHYRMFLKHEAVDRPECSIVGCTTNAITKGLCSKHYNRLLRHEDPMEYSGYDPNEFVDNKDGTTGIVLKNKKGVEVGRAVIDNEMLPLVQNYKWHLGKNGYAGTFKKRKHLYLHHLVSTETSMAKTDHIDRDRMNNRRSNLRKATNFENSRNAGVRSNNSTGGFIGISYSKSRFYWESYIKVDGKKRNLGSYKSKHEAFLARLRAEKIHYKDFAPQRHLFEAYGI